MCGIVGYIGKNNGVPFLIDGLKQLEYRGYDSAGIAYFDGKNIRTLKKVGRVSALAEAAENLSGGAGIGHTRWATHGKPNYENAHPHSYGKFSVVHNGIIENYIKLKENVSEDEFQSETDTEVIAHLLQRNYDGDFLTAVAKTVAMLEGCFALAILCEDCPNALALARRGNPILAGHGNGEYFAASDVVALAKKTKNIYQLTDDSVAIINEDGIAVYDKDLKPLVLEKLSVNVEPNSLDLGGHDTFMIKEIFETPKTLSDTVSNFYHNTDLNLLRGKFKNAKKITVVGCGTAYHSGLVGKYLIERLARIPVETEIASEFRYKNPIILTGDIFIAVSQSGETADTIAAAKLAKELGAFIVVVTNVKYSSITRYADVVLPTVAGTEIGVAATKSYEGQIAVFTMLAIEAASARQNADMAKIRKFFLKLPHLTQEVLDRADEIKNLADELLCADSVFFVGRNLDYAVALEGSLKLKEITYKHSEGYAAGELKHGTIALIDGKSVVVAVITQTATAEKTMNAVNEVKARGAKVLLVTSLPEFYEAGEADLIFALPQTEEIFAPITAVIPLQLFAYYTAVLLGRDPDKPRNLAKSVTVE